jgi:hypothetical protein
MKELELTIHSGEDPIQDASLLEIREDLPEGQAPSPSLAASNKSFGTSYRGELLSVGCRAASIRDGTSKILTLWKSHTLVDETGEGASEQTTHLPGETARDSGKKPCTSLKRTLVSSGKPSASLGKKINSKDLSKKGSLLFRFLRFPCFGFLNLCTYGFCSVIFQNLRIFFDLIRCPNSHSTVRTSRRKLLYAEEFLVNA